MPIPPRKKQKSQKYDKELEKMHITFIKPSQLFLLQLRNHVLLFFYIMLVMGGSLNSPLRKTKVGCGGIANHLLCTVEHYKTINNSASSLFCKFVTEQGEHINCEHQRFFLNRTAHGGGTNPVPKNFNLMFRTSESSFPHLTEAGETESQEWLNQERHKDQRYFYK